MEAMTKLIIIKIKLPILTPLHRRSRVMHGLKPYIIVII
jgi:hypothetical protein